MQLQKTYTFSLEKRELDKLSHILNNLIDTAYFLDEDKYQDFIKDLIILIKLNK